MTPPFPALSTEQVLRKQYLQVTKLSLPMAYVIHSEHNCYESTIHKALWWPLTLPHASPLSCPLPAWIT